MSPFSRRDLVSLIGIVLLTVIVFANGLRGDFVLDDQKQIVRNDLIRSPRFWGEALRRDLWAFQGERDKPSSNYWRPGHVAWLILNYQLFGARPAPWHVTSLMAHLGVIVCGYVVVRWLGATRGVATTILCIFAVHPTRCESVTWIAGAHDVLATFWQLLALILVMSIWRRQAAGDRPGLPAQVLHWSAAVVCYVLAVSTKEIAIFFPIVAALIRMTDPDLAEALTQRRWSSALVAAAPFALVAMIFLALRWAVLEGLQLRLPWQPSVRTIAATVPLVVFFYLRQIIFPWWIGWSYPLRAVESIGVWNFFAPLAILAALVYAARWFVRGRLELVGAAIFVLSLLPALNLKAFLPEQIVKDRYLYLPLLGFLMVTVPLVAELLRRTFAARALSVQVPLVVLIVSLLAVRTMQYNRAWTSEAAVWRWAVWSDPGSAVNRQGLGNALIQQGQFESALEELNRAIQIHDWPEARSARADALTQLNRFDDAAADCRWILGRDPGYFRAYERLAIVYERQDHLDEAAVVLRQGRDNVPYRSAIFTDKLASVLVRQGKKREAIAELESARGQAEADFAPGSRAVLFHLGMLYGQSGRMSEAVAVLRRFLELTEGSGDPNILDYRQRAQAALRAVR